MKNPFRFISRYAKLYYACWVHSIKAKFVVKQRINTFINFFARAFAQLASLVFIWVIFDKIPHLAGWSIEEVAFIFGIQSICSGFVEIFIGAIWAAGDIILRGTLNMFLVMPVSPVFLMLLRTGGLGNTNGTGPVIIGIAMLIITSPVLNVVWNFQAILFIILIVISGSLIYFGLSLIFVSVTFWTKERLYHELFHVFPQFARYPINIYNQFIRIFLTWIMPFAFTGFYPALFFLGRKDYGIMPFLTPLIGGIFCSLGVFVWRSGLKKYEGTGT